MDKCIFIPVKKRLKNHFLKQPVMNEKAEQLFRWLNYVDPAGIQITVDPAGIPARLRHAGVGTSDPPK
jgi:hypothetical protein